MNIIGIRTIKSALGATIAITIAQFLGLKYAVASGIITILSVQSTKRQSIEMAMKRLISTIIALFISSILFVFIGFNEYVFGLYLLIFIPVTANLKITEGIVVSSVLVTHLLVEKSVDFFWIKNEIALFLIGAGTALIFNLYMPSIVSKLEEDKEYIENKMKDILLDMSYTLKLHCVSINEQRLFEEIEIRLSQARNRAYKNFNNYLFSDVKYYIHYIEMRNIQFEIIKYMREHCKNFISIYKQTELVANFTEKVAMAIGEPISSEELLEELESLKYKFKRQSLPKTRDEFEYRAKLFQYIMDLQRFLEIRKDYVLKLKE
ncbi:aromatic acid exporter family protein [Clostridium tarantellae]|uniref:Aromatic acid exporter family protein n=1 Tax=Clostridium tarantellae TaxID=39493 RepID=A0A6I1MMP6_9CLOT|nr:aromatic acid exporter family protein [Clostridium tarantellae]MPQ44766.1 aromatic acid exporter family protein [Clostridium tarantellae]